MAKYIIEDTAEGYRLSLAGKTITHSIDEEGGHGPIESLFAMTERLWSSLRQEVRNG